MSRVAGFVPTALDGVLVRVRKVHPTIDETLCEPPGSLVERLRQRLLTTSLEKVPELAQAVSPRELGAALFLLEDGEVGEKSERLLRARPRGDLMRAGWRYLLANYRIRRLEGLIPVWSEDLGWAPIADERVTPGLLQRWFATALLDRGLMRHWELELRGAGDLPGDWLERFDLARYVRLEEHFWRRVLTESHGETLQSIPAQELIRRAGALPREIREEFGSHYLMAVGGLGQWDERVLLWIEESFGIPKRGEIQTPFWRRVPEAQRVDFLRWHALRKLEEFLKAFHDPQGRFEFWKPFVEAQVPDLQLRCKDRTLDLFLAVCLRFRGWGVIEFGPVGNAAYVYPEAEYTRIVDRNDPWPSDYKDKWTTLKSGPRNDGRIVHQPGWQEVNRPWIEGLIRRSR